jgi:hypothetical protein
MAPLLPLVERRLRRRLLKAALRRRNQGRPSAILQERRVAPGGALATLHGYRRFIARRSSTARRVAALKAEAPLPLS